MTVQENVSAPHPRTVPLQAAPVRAKKATSKSSIDPKDVENDFVKRELNIVKVHLQEKEAEVKDLTRKNKVLADMIEIFEKKSQKDMTDRNHSTSPANKDKCCSHAASPTSRASTDIIQPDMVNKLLNFLVDLNLQFCHERIKSHSDSDSSEPTILSSPSKDHPQSHQDPLTPDQVPVEVKMSTQPHVVAENLSCDDSDMALDEFAPELSQESFNEVLETSEPVDSSVNHLNFHIQTNQ